MFLSQEDVLPHAMIGSHLKKKKFYQKIIYSHTVMVRLHVFHMIFWTARMCTKRSPTNIYKKIIN
jgi:hypothetical protein